VEFFFLWNWAIARWSRKTKLCRGCIERPWRQPIKAQVLAESLLGDEGSNEGSRVRTRVDRVRWTVLTWEGIPCIESHHGGHGHHHKGMNGKLGTRSNSLPLEGEKWGCKRYNDNFSRNGSIVLWVQVINWFTWASVTNWILARFL